MKRKIITMLFVFVLAFSIAGGITESAQAAVAPRSVAIWDNAPTIKKSGSFANLTSTVSFFDGYSVKVTITLEQSSDNSSWDSFRSWDLGSVSSGTKYSKSASLTSGYYYRTTVTATAYSGTTYVETVTSSSSSIYY